MADKNSTQELKEIRAAALTLDPDERRQTGCFEEPAMEGMKIGSMTGEAEASAGAVSESMLTEEEKKQVEAFADQIDVKNVKMVNSYGAGAQNGIAAFSASITGNVSTKEFGEVGNSLRELKEAISSTVVPEKKGFLGLFQKGKQKLSSLISNYETAETSIRKIEKDLQQHRQVLTKDI